MSGCLEQAGIEIEWMHRFASIKFFHCSDREHAMDANMSKLGIKYFAYSVSSDISYSVETDSEELNFHRFCKGFTA